MTMVRRLGMALRSGHPGAPQRCGRASYGVGNLETPHVPLAFTGQRIGRSILIFTRSSTFCHKERAMKRLLTGVAAVLALLVADIFGNVPASRADDLIVSP